MANPLNPQPQRNYLDDILDQAFNDLEMERQRQESIINANDPDKVLSQLNKVDKQIENEPEEVQQAVRQKVYKPGYFDRDRQMMDWKPQGKSVVESKDNTKSIDETIQRYEQYEQLFPQYFQEEYDKVVQDLGQVKTSEDRDVIRGPFSKEPTYTEQDLETKAITQAKKRLSDEGILEPKRTFLGTLKETFTDYKKFGSKLPYLGGGVEAYEALDLLQSIKDIQRGTADQADYATVMNAQLEMERDSGFGAMVIDIMLQLPAYAVEFSTTAGTYTAGRKAGQKALQESVNWVLSKQGKKIIKEGADRFGLKAVKGVVGATTGTLARTVDPKMFSRVVANVSRELLPDYELNRKLDGKLEVLSSNEKSLGKSIVDGYLLTYLELLGEQSGEAIPFLGKEFKTFLKSKPESAVHGLLKSLIRKNPDVPPGKFMQGVRQAGIQSVPVELMEERFTDFLQSGVEGHEFEWPTAEEWLAEIVAIGGFSASVRGVGKGLDKRAEKKLEKAKAKGLEAIESGQLRQLTDQDISDFGRSLTKEEAMEIGIAQETGEVDPGSELGKEMIRRELDMEKFPETLRELREEEARKTIKEQKIEGEDFVGKLIEKAQSESGIAIEREYLDRTLADEIADEELSEERAKEILREHGIDEKTNPEEIMITGRTSGFVVRLSTAGTQERMAEEFVAVSEEMAEVYYNAEVENIGEQEFENEIAKDRKNYHEATGEQDTGESNKEWFSTMALRFATQGKVHKSIGAKLKQIFQDLMERAQILLQDAFRLQRHIKEGKVSDSLLKKLEEATDFKKVGEKVQQAKESKKDPTYRLAKESGGDLVWKNTPIVKQPNLLELTKYLTERAKSIADELGVDLTQNTPEAIDIVSNVIAEEIKIETGNKKNALGWYSIKMQNAIELLSQIHPEIMQDPDHNQVFKVALAITSNGTPVEDNLKIAMVAYEHWKDNGVLPSTFKVGGQEGPAMASAFKVYNKHQKEIGTTAFHTFLNTEFTVKEITDMGYKVNGELVDAKVMGAVIFGPKVGGGFLSNLNGHYQYLTMDRWFMRTMGRIRGNLKEQKDYSEQLKRFRTALRINPSKMKLYNVSKEDLKNDDKVIEIARKVLKEYAKPKYVKKENRKKSFYPKTKLNKASNTLVKNIDKIYEAPANGTDRKYLRQIMEKAVEKSNVEGLTMADAQAIIWFPEKRFFSKFGVGSQRGKKETDYETEARKYVESRLGSVQPIGSSARRSATGIKESTQKPESLGKEKPTYRLAPTFYSKAERVVTEQFPPTMKSQSVENFLKKNQVKPEEIQWLDLETLLKGKQKVTKEELQEYIQANKIEVEDVMLGELVVDELNPSEVEGEENYIEEKPTKYSSYQLPGEKEDYRELLLTLPVDYKEQAGIFENGKFTGIVFNTPEEAHKFKKENQTVGLVSSGFAIIDRFTTGHHDEPNILAHVRFNTRRSPTGEKVLFIEELQSDWHTKGREKGYKQQITELPEGSKIEEIPGNKIVMLRPDGKRMLTTLTDISDPEAEITVKRKALSYLNQQNKDSVPDAPFKGNGWIELIMKRMLRYASENNFDRIAWTTANQQIDRWKNELRQNVDQISWQRTTRKKIEVGGFSTTTQEMMAESGYKGKEEIGDYVIVNGLKKNESVFNQTIPIEGETTINGQKVTLEGLLGKQMATQIRNSEDRTGIIEGDNLTVGGQGFKVVYDFAIKKILNKMGKKFNAKVDQVILRARTIDEVSVAVDGYQPSIRVTRKMKESALKGQPTFRASKMTSSDDVLSSPSFKKWFKGSQVKDKDGKPLVVYHGTEYDFEDFDTRYGSYFSSDPKYAEGYANKPFSRKDKVSGISIGANIRPVYLSIKNPKILIEPKDDEDFAEAYRSHPYEQLKAEGYDGAIIKWNDGEVEAYVLEPTQIKSIFNKGTFNPHDPRISFRMAPTNLVTPLAKIYQEQKGNKKSYTKENFELDLVRLGYPEETIKTAMDLFGIIRIKQIETTEPTPIEKELKKIQDLHITRSNLKDRIKRAYRLGAVEKEKEIVKLQKIVTKYARENLPKGIYNKSEVTGLLAKVRDAKRARELATALERIDRIVDRVNKRSALAKWNKTVKKKATVKKVGGIGRGKVGADVQDIVDDIRGKRKGTGIMDLSPVEVEEKIELMGKVMGESEDGEPTDDQALQLNLLLTYGAMKHKTPEEITRATEQFDELVTAGRMQVIEDQEAYKERMKEVRQEIIDVITGGVGAQTQAGAQTLGLKKKGLLADIKETLSTIDSENQSLEYIFDKLSRLDKTSKPLESAINNYFMPMIRQARLAEYSGLVEMNTMLKENAERIFKVKDRKLTKRLNENTVNTINVQHRDGVDGPIVYSELTYNQAYKKWMELKDATLHPTFEDMGWNVNKSITQIEDQLPKDMIKWAEWQLYDFYPMYYQRVNEVFRKRFNVNMPFNPTYSPISRMVGAKADEGDDTLNKSKSPMGSMTSAGSLKGRVSNTKELTWVDGDTTILKHITEMEHFIHYTQVMRELRSVFMSEDVSNSISNFHGKGISRTLNKFMDDIARGGVDRSQNLIWMDKLRANFSRSVIGINPVVYLKQLASIPAYISDVPTLDWATEFAKVFNPLEFKRAYKTLSKSKMVQMRYDQGFERDMVLALQNQKPGKLLSGTDYINTIAYAFTKMGDKQAIFLGGWPVYKYHKKKALKEGKSLKDAETIAMKQFEASSLRSQQASNVEDLGDFQRRGSAYKLFTMFMTSPNQYYRMIISGYRNFRAGRGSKSENLRKIIVGQFVLTTLFQFISNAFKWDDEDQAISVLLYPFAGLLFFGQGFEYAIRSAFNKAYPMGPVSILDPLVDIGKGLKKTFDGKEFDNKKVFKILDEYISGLSKIFGIPYSGPKRSVENTIKVLTEDSDLSLKDKTLKGVGFRIKEKPKIKIKKKPKVGGPVYAY